MVIDTHAHIFEKYYENLEEEINNIIDKGIIVFNSGVDIESNIEVIKMAKRYDNFFATIGIHPTELKLLSKNYIKQLEKLLKSKKVVAIGEIGLDYYHDDSNKRKQKEVFINQIRLAKKYNLPIIIHSRDTLDDVFKILTEEKVEKIGGIIHCYSGDIIMAKKFIKMNFLIGIGGIATFKNAKMLKEVIEELEISNFALETDAPYLAPEPYRGKKNSPVHLSFIIKEIEKIKKVSYNDIEAIIEKSVRAKFLERKGN